MSTAGGPCRGCEQQQRLGRRGFLALLGTGMSLVAAAVAWPGRDRATAAVRPAHRSRPSSATALPDAPPAPILADPTGGPPLTLGQFPPARPGPAKMIWQAPTTTQQIALTIDDGDCGDCIAKYVAFAQSSGIHITFNPNGAFDAL